MKLRVERKVEPLSLFTATCGICGSGCTGKGFCPGDALASLPCRSQRRMEMAGAGMPTWKELLLRDEHRYDLL